MLLVADPHFGKAATFRALGVRVPRGTTEGTLARLAAAYGDDAVVGREDEVRRYATRSMMSVLAR
jgi:metallophosphoesterase superfamily enzyme